MANERLKRKFKTVLDANLAGQNGFWDREDKALMENYFVFIKNENGEYERTTLDAHMDELEKLSDEQYKEEMNSLILADKIFYYNPKSPSTLAYFNLALKINDIEFDNEGVVQPRNAAAEKTRDNVAIATKLDYYREKKDPDLYKAAQIDSVSRIAQRKAEIANPKLLEKKAVERLKEKEKRATEHLGTLKTDYDQLFSLIKQQNGDISFDRFDLNNRDNFSVMDKGDDGLITKRSLSSYIAQAEELPVEQYKQKMQELFEQRNIMVNEPGSFMPTMWGLEDGTDVLRPALRITTKVFELENSSKEESLAFDRKTIGKSFFNNELYTDKKLKTLSLDEATKKISEYKRDATTDLPPREKMPWYFKNKFFRSIAFSLSNNAQETYRRISSINDAYEKRAVFAEYVDKEKVSIAKKAIKQAEKITEKQNTLLLNRPTENIKQKEKADEIQSAQTQMQNQIVKGEGTVKSNSKTILQQAESYEKAGWRITNLLGDGLPNLKGFKNYQIDTKKLPENANVIIDTMSKDEFSATNHAYFNFAKLLTTAYAPKEGGEVQNAIKSIIPPDLDIKSTPPTFIARQLINEVFSGKANANVQSFLEPLIIEAKESANYSIEQNNKGNKKPMADDIRAGATILLNVLNSTTPQEFADQSGKWPLAAKCVKELVQITKSCPDIIKESPIDQEMLNEMKGWEKVSDAITNSAKAKKILLSSNTVSKEERETLWNEIFLESKLRGLCANAYKSNNDINKSIKVKSITDDNLFGKETVCFEFAYSNKNAKAMCALGKDDMLLQSIKDSIDVNAVKQLENKTSCASWIAGHLKYNNEINAEMVAKVLQSVTKEQARPIKKEEERQLKSDKDMLSI